MQRSEIFRNFSGILKIISGTEIFACGRPKTRPHLGLQLGGSNRKLSEKFPKKFRNFEIFGLNNVAPELVTSPKSGNMRIFAMHSHEGELRGATQTSIACLAQFGATAPLGIAQCGDMVGTRVAPGVARRCGALSSRAGAGAVRAALRLAAPRTCAF